MNTKQIRCLAIDDEPLALEKLVSYISRTPFLELAAACEGPHEAIQAMSENEVDAIFVDIDMPDMNGMEFICSLPEKPLTVFTTAYTDYAVESYKVQAVDYLLKPFGFADFQRAANKLLRQTSLIAMEKEKAGFQRLKTDGNPSIYVKTDYRYVRIRPDDICYIEGMNEYLRIHLSTDNGTIVTHSTMKHILKNLPENFLQVHRSFIVNMDRIVETERASILMDGDTRIPVGDIYKDGFFNYLKSRSIGKK